MKKKNKRIALVLILATLLSFIDIGNFIKQITYADNSLYSFAEEEWELILENSNTTNSNTAFSANLSYYQNFKVDSTDYNRYINDADKYEYKLVWYFNENNNSTSNVSVQFRVDSSIYLDPFLTIEIGEMGYSGELILNDYFPKTYGQEYLALIVNLTMTKPGYGPRYCEFQLYRKKKYPPEISITSPLENQEFHKGNKVEIQWSAFDRDGDNLTYNIKIGTTPGGSDLYNGPPNGTVNNTSGRHNFDTSSIALTWNSSKNRYERKIYITASAYDGSIITEDTRNILIINYRPSIIVTTSAITNHNINTDSPFILSGKAWDSNGDRLTIQATIVGKTKSQVINVSPTSQPTPDNWSLTWSGDDLQEGVYGPVTINITDDKGGSHSIVWNGTIIVKDVLKIIDSKIKEHFPPISNNDIRIIVPNTNIEIRESTTNNATSSSIKNNATKLNSDLFFIGKGGSTKNYIESRITNNYAINTNNVEIQLSEYILNRLKDINTNIFVVGNDINTNMLFTDIEKDYESITVYNKLKTNEELIELEKSLGISILQPKTGTLQAKYSHDPSIFDNPVPKHYKADENWHIVSGIDDSFIIKKALFDMRGKWSLTMKGSDDTRNANFDKYSDDREIEFIIHEKPTAIINAWEVSDENYHYLTAEKSFDLDYEYILPNNGIVDFTWYYQLEDGSWYEYSKDKRITIPRRISNQDVVQFSLTVEDYHGAKDTNTTNAPPLLDPEPIIIVPDNTYLGPLGSDRLQVNNATYPKSIVDIFRWTFSFKSEDGNYKNESFSYDGESYTFNKNTLKYKIQNHDVFNKLVKLGIYFNEKYKETSENIKFTPIIIRKLNLEPQGNLKTKVTADIPNSNISDHIVKAVYKGNSYIMSYNDSEGLWRSPEIYTPSADEIIVSIYSKSDESIKYDEKTIIPNSPPTIKLTKSPNIIYEGDNVTAYMEINDPDGDLLAVNLYLDDALVYTKTNVPSGSVVSYTLNSNYFTDITKNYHLRATVTDSFNVSDEDSLTFNINELFVNGFVQHTEQWNKNRITYNKAKTGNEDNPRSYDVFFPGEKFILVANTTVIDPERVAEDGLHCESVHVKIDTTIYSTYLSSNNTNNTHWIGQLWDDTMLKWNNRDLIFTFTATFNNNSGNSRTKTVQVPIRVIDDAFWRQHRKF